MEVSWRERWAGPERTRTGRKRTHIGSKAESPVHWLTSKGYYTRQRKKCKEGEEMLGGEARIREGEPQLCFRQALSSPRSTPQITQRSAASAPNGRALPFVGLPSKHNSFWRKLNRPQKELVQNTLSQKTDCPQASRGSTGDSLCLRLPHRESIYHRLKISGEKSHLH